MQNTIETMKSLTFGTELEYTGIARQVAAKAIQGVIGGRVRFTGGDYDAWEVTAPDGRIWKAIRDGSLENGGCEVVTPILRWEDMATLQEVVRALRKAGAKATSDTSQHIHIGAQSFNPAQIANFAKIFYKQEELILKSLGTPAGPLRQAHRSRIQRTLERPSPDHQRKPEQSLVRVSGAEPQPLRKPQIPRSEPEQHLANRHDRSPGRQRQHPRGRDQSKHHPLPGDRGEGPDRKKHLQQESPGMRHPEREIRHAGFPGLRPGAEWRRVQKHPPAPPETAPRQRRLEERRTGRIRSKKRTTGPRGPIKSKTNERNITP